MQPSTTPLRASDSILCTNSKTFSGNNTTVYTPIFRVTGSVRILRLWAVVTTTLSGKNHTNAYFDLYDQTANLDITADGATLSGEPVGTTLVKTGLLAAAATVVSASAGALLEPAAAGELVTTEFLVVKKDGANTDIEYVYTTTDTPTSGAMQFFVEWQPRSATGSVVAV